jgi:hypothetical protein
MAVEPEATAPSEPEPSDSDLAKELEAEHGLARAIIIGTLIATPICVVVWMGLIALAVSGTGTGLAAPLAMGAGIGVLTGALFGTWAGFVSKTHTFEEFDRQCNARRRSPGTSPNA